MVTKKPSAKKPATKKVGRPKSLLPGIVESNEATILARLEAGESLNEICRTPGMPSPAAVLKRADAEPDFCERYASARAIGYARLAEEILEISDEIDVRAKYDGEDVTLAMDSTAVARNKLRVDTRKWILAKMLPKVFGERQTIDANIKHTGDDLILQLAAERKG